MSGVRGAVAARLRGDDFQGRIFWTEAMRMFDRRPRVERVGIEVSNYKHFDDVVVLYGTDHGRDHDLECHQAKFHVRNNDALSWEAMMSPGWLGVTGLSLMQRVLEAHRQHAGRANLYFTTPWTVDINDALSKLLMGAGDRLDVNVLFASGPTSQQGRARAKLIEHLHCEEQVLREVLSRLRIRDRAKLDRMQSDLDYRLEAHNFVPVGDLAVNAYDDLARKIIQGEVNMFNAAELRSLLDKAGLIDTAAAAGPAPWRVGIRSFERQAVYLDEEMDKLLDLLPFFDGRFLRDDLTWNGHIGPIVRDFMTKIDDQRRDDVELHLHCKLSVAYGAGAAVSRKSATRYSFRQLGQRGTEIWRVNKGVGAKPEETWTVGDVDLRQDARDVAVAVAVSNDSGKDARLYVERHLPSVGRLLILEPVGGIGQRSVRDGAHAYDMGETFANIANDRRTHDQRKSLLHVLPSVPASVAFTMGRAGTRLGPTQLYEFALERNEPEGYSPSISLNTA
ncbi:MAG: SAVED domain-containing protein [Candidatus Dormibacteria bacterium]